MAGIILHNNILVYIYLEISLYCTLFWQENLYFLQIYFDVIEEIDCIIDKHVCALIKSDFHLHDIV